MSFLGCIHNSRLPIEAVPRVFCRAAQALESPSYGHEAHILRIVKVCKDVPMAI